MYVIFYERQITSNVAGCIFLNEGHFDSLLQPAIEPLGTSSKLEDVQRDEKEHLASAGMHVSSLVVVQRLSTVQPNTCMSFNAVTSFEYRQHFSCVTYRRQFDW